MLFSQFDHNQGNHEINWSIHVYGLIETDPCPNTIRKSDAVQHAFTQLASVNFGQQCGHGL